MTMKPTVTFIPGMFSPFINTFLGTYFIDQMEYLDKKHVPYFVMPVHTEGTLERNAIVIRENLLDKENVIAFCHSKGGIDLLHALILYPELRERFKKIIFMQCPFYGTPLADVALGNNVFELATRGIFRLLLAGDVRAIQELSKRNRTLYMDRNSEIIHEITNKIEIDCIGSAKNSEPGRFDSILKIPRDFMQLRFNLPNDGMIPLESAFVKGARKREFTDLDHASAVIRLTPQQFDRKAFTHSVFQGVLA